MRAYGGMAYAADLKSATLEGSSPSKHTSNVLMVKWQTRQLEVLMLRRAGSTPVEDTKRVVS